MNILIHRDGQSYGPYTLDQVKHYLGNGSLVENDLAWHEGCVDWLPVKDIISPPGTPPPAPHSSQGLTSEKHDDEKELAKIRSLRTEMSQAPLKLGGYLLVLAFCAFVFYLLGAKIIGVIIFLLVGLGCIAFIFLLVGLNLLNKKERDILNKKTNRK